MTANNKHCLQTFGYLSQFNFYNHVHPPPSNSPHLYLENDKKAVKIKEY